MPRALPSRRPIVDARAPLPPYALGAALALAVLALTAVVTPALADRDPTPAERARIEDAPPAMGCRGWGEIELDEDDGGRRRRADDARAPTAEATT